MWAIVLVGVVSSLLMLSRDKLFNVGRFNVLIFGLGFLYWLYWLIGGIYEHKNAGKSVARIDRIVTSGVYASVRHPIYHGDLVFGWAIFFSLPSIAMLFAVIWASAVFLIWANVEEMALSRKFGKEYTDYKKKVGMIVPRVW